MELDSQAVRLLILTYAGFRLREFKNLESGVHELWLVKCGVSGVESNSSGHFDIGRDRQPWEDYDGNTMS
jgi:hypothetical protein